MLDQEQSHDSAGDQAESFIYGSEFVDAVVSNPDGPRTLRFETG